MKDNSFVSRAIYVGTSVLLGPEHDRVNLTQRPIFSDLKFFHEPQDLQTRDAQFTFPPEGFCTGLLETSHQPQPGFNTQTLGLEEITLDISFIQYAHCAYTELTIIETNTSENYKSN